MAGEVSQSHAKSAGIVSIFMLIFAVINLITGFVFVSYGAKDATGIWIGLLLAVAGSLGVIVWVKKSKTVMIFFLVVCIVDIICCIVQAALAAIAFIIWQFLKAVIESKCTITAGKCDCGNEKVPMQLEDCSWISAIEVVFLVILIVNGLAAIFMLAGSIIGCMATCCASSPQQQGVVVIQQPGTVVTTYPAQQYPAGAQQYPAAQQCPPTYGQTEMTQKA